MVTMNITFDNPMILPALEELITNLKGVKEVTISNNNVTEVPNAETRAAIRELRAGKGIKCKNIDDLFEQLNS
jgi:Leucine-rich repeat (LRR) protein